MVSLVFTVRVGPDRPQGQVKARTSVRNLEGVPRLHRLCEAYGVKPTYLVAWPIAARREGRMLAERWAKGAAEVGAWLQPWVTPPFEANEDRLVSHPPSAMPASAVQAKLEQLTETITERMGQTPRCHRAAGGGLDGAGLQALERLGYTADLSARPLTDSRAIGGVDWRAAPREPWFPARQDPARRGSSPVLMLPETAGFDRPLPGSVARLLVTHRLIDPVRQALARRNVPRTALVRLDPTHSELDAMRALCDAELARGAPALHLSVASEALWPGCSDRCHEPADAERSLDRLDGILRYAVDSLRAAPRTVSGFVRHHLGIDRAA